MTRTPPADDALGGIDPTPEFAPITAAEVLSRMEDVARRDRGLRGYNQKPKRDLTEGKSFQPLRDQGEWALLVAIDLVYFAQSNDVATDVWPYDKIEDKHGYLDPQHRSGRQLVEYVLGLIQQCNPTWYEKNVAKAIADKETRVAAASLDAASPATGTTLHDKLADGFAVGTKVDSTPDTDTLDRGRVELHTHLQNCALPTLVGWAQQCRADADAAGKRGNRPAVDALEYEADACDTAAEVVRLLVSQRTTEGLLLAFDAGIAHPGRQGDRLARKAADHCAPQRLRKDGEAFLRRVETLLALAARMPGTATAAVTLDDLRTELHTALADAVADALADGQHGAGLVWTVIDTGMAVLARHTAVTTDDGSAVTVLTATQAIVDATATAVTDPAAHADPLAVFTAQWIARHGWQPAPLTEAKQLAAATGTTLPQLRNAKVLRVTGNLTHLIGPDGT